MSESSPNDEDELTPVISIEASPGGGSQESEPLRRSDGQAPLKKLGAYEILRSIGSGGMAEVFLARHAGPMGFEKILVLKCIHPHLAREKNFVDMFLDEARLAARINDPRVVQIHELGEADGRYFMAMEYLAGETLSAILKLALRDGPVLPPALAARIVADAAAGLHTAHELRDNNGRQLEVVHRDVSHSNIVVLYSGAVKLLDFGVAKARDSLQTTSAGERKGKYGYMSPEQVRGEPIDRRSDVFSLGVVLWEALTKQRLFAADSELETVRRVIDGVPPKPSSIVATISPELDAIVMKALAKDRRERYQTADAMASALEGYLRTSGAAATMSDVASFMKTGFASRIERREGLGRANTADGTGSDAPLADIPTAASKDSSLHTELISLRRSRTRFRILLAALGGSLVLFAAYHLGRTRADDARGTAAAAVVPTAAPAHPVEPTTPASITDDDRALVTSLFDRAQTAIDEGKVASPPGDNALELILDAEKRAPGDPRSVALRKAAVARLLDDAEALWKAGKQDSARTIYADALLFDPEQPLAKQRAHAPVHSTSAAAMAESKAASEEVPWLVTQIDLAIIERRLVAPPGRNALEFLQRLRKLDPQNEVVRRLGGEVATALHTEAKQKPDQAKTLTAAAKVASGEAASLQEAAAAEPTEKIGDPKLAAQWVATGNQKLAAGQLAEARAAFERAVNADSGAHAALAGLAEVAYNESDYTRAVLAAKRALALAPKSAAYRMLLAKSYYKLLRYEDAIKQWQKVLEVEPTNAAAQKNIEMARRRMGDGE